ncbi:Protein M6.4 [Aphelenchoides avenae]|nr:Protein M6.4 [Aphelenchus avenae]
MKVSVVLSASSLLFACTDVVAHNYMLGSRRQYNRPTCEPNESCLYSALGHQFELCDCPDFDSPCQKGIDNVAFQDGINYFFCKPRAVPTCENGETASVVQGLQTIINCVCPGRMIAATSERDDSTEFVCRLLPSTPKKSSLRRRKISRKQNTSRNIAAYDEFA